MPEVKVKTCAKLVVANFGWTKHLELYDATGSAILVLLRLRQEVQ